MNKPSKLFTICPVLSTSDLERDIKWYNENVGFNLHYQEEGYAVLNRDSIYIHLQWHHNNEVDPVQGSVIKIFVDNIHPIFQEMMIRGIVTKNKLCLNTSWKTHEFGFFDLNKNALFFVQDV